MSRLKDRPQFKMYEVGEIIEIGKTNRETLTTEWFEANVVKLMPFTVQYLETEEIEELPLGTLRRRPEKKEEPVKKPELPAEYRAELYYKALVEIIREGSTTTPNSTVKRMLNIAKEAIGEVPV